MIVLNGTSWSTERHQNGLTVVAERLKVFLSSHDFTFCQVRHRIRKSIALEGTECLLQLVTFMRRRSPLARENPAAAHTGFHTSRSAPG